jgi:methylmalonyl-CoA mutase N-terminal domain/subunit
MATKKSKSKEPEKKIFTDSNFPVKRIYQKSSKKRTTEDAGKFPFTRGIHPGMYRDRFWTMRDFGPCVSILDLEMQS